MDDMLSYLDRVDIRLKKLGMSQTEAGMRAGKPDAIRNLRRGVKKGNRKYIATETNEALATALRTTPMWLLYNEGPEELDAATTQSVVGDETDDRLDINETLLVFSVALEQFGAGSPDDCRRIVRSLLRLVHIFQRQYESQPSLMEKRRRILEAVQIVRP